MDSKSKVENSLESTNYLLMNSIKLCDKYYNQIEKKLRQLTVCRNESSSLLENSNELKDLEQQFWTDLKTFKEANEPIVLQYIVGVYSKLQQIALLYSNLNKKNDVYFIHGITLKGSETDFLYNVYIHLGDLSRYQKSTKIAKQYYLKARSLNPHNGQSYNQLALIYGSDAIKSIYFYVRAYLATEPSKIAFNNLKLSVKHFLNTNQLIKLLFDNPIPRPEKIKVENWLYLIVIAIFADNMNAISQYLFDDINYWFKFKNISINSHLHEEKDETDNKYLFAGFDLFLDYCLSLNTSIGQQEASNADSKNTKTSILFSTKFNLYDHEKQLKDLKQMVDLYSTKVNSNSTLDLIALRHDFLLQGLNLLQAQHSNLIFTDKNSKYAKNLNLLICRIGKKLNQLIASIEKKEKQVKQPQKKMRNVALQSILSGANS